MRELNIDWTALHSAFQMNMPEVRCFLSLEDGKVLKLPPGDPALPRARTETQRFAPIEAIPSRIQYQWLDSFIKSVEDPEIRGRMESAVNGKGAFRRFKDILLTLPDERRRWFEFRDQLLRVRIIEWVHELGIDATNEPPWNGAGEGEVPAGEVKPKPNAPEDVEALRDYLIDWFDGRPPAEAVSPLNLEKLAGEIALSFRVKPL